RAGRHRAGVQPERARPAVRPGHRPPRLHADAGPRAARGHHVHRRELHGGPHICLDRSEDQVPLMGVNPPLDILTDVDALESAPRWLDGLREFARRRPLGTLGGAIIVLLVAVAVLAPLLATHNPLANDYGAMLSPPGAQHWLGTDAHGRDVYSRLL